MDPVRVTPVHRIGAGSKRFALPAAIRSVARGLPINDVRGDRQNRLRVEGVAVSGTLPQLVHESANEPGGQVVHSIVVITKLWILAFRFVICDQSGVIANHSYLGIADG